MHLQPSLRHWNLKKARGRQAVLKYTNFNNLTFLAWGKYEMSNFGKTGMILQIAQIVHNDSLVKEIQSAHDHLR